MSKKIYCLFILAMLAVSSAAAPLHALTFRYSDDVHYEATSKSIRKILSTQITEDTPVASVNLMGYSIYKAFIIALQIMQESAIVADVEYPVMAPDQSLFFIPYFPEAKPDKLHFIVLHRLPNPKTVAFCNFNERGFNKFTAEHYHTRFHYVKTQKAVR